MDLVIDSVTRGSWAVLDVQGELDGFTAPKLRERLVELIDQGHDRIVVALDRVGFMDSTGLGTLVSGLKRIKERNGVLALVTTGRPTLRLLQITGLDSVFPIHATIDEAVGAER